MNMFVYNDLDNWWEFYEETIDKFKIYANGFDRVVGPLSLLQFRFKDFSIFLSFDIAKKVKEGHSGIILDDKFNIFEEGDKFIARDRMRNIVAIVPKRLFRFLENAPISILKIEN